MWWLPASEEWPRHSLPHARAAAVPPVAPNSLLPAPAAGARLLADAACHLQQLLGAMGCEAAAAEWKSAVALAQAPRASWQGAKLLLLAFWPVAPRSAPDARSSFRREALEPLIPCMSITARSTALRGSMGVIRGWQRTLQATAVSSHTVVLNDCQKRDQ